MLIVRKLRPSNCIMFLLAFTFMAAISNTSAAQVQSNVTVMTYSSSHGTQVEYLGSNGMSYLWYPGNRVVLPAPWKVENGQMCYRYGKRTYNPVTKTKGGKWECRPVAISKQSVVDSARGDIFGLSKRKSVPFILTRARTTLSKLGKGSSGSTRSKKPKKIDRTSRRDIQRLMASCPSASELMTGGNHAYIVAGGIYFWGEYARKNLATVRMVVHGWITRKHFLCFACLAIRASSNKWSSSSRTGPDRVTRRQLQHCAK